MQNFISTFSPSKSFQFVNGQLSREEDSPHCHYCHDPPQLCQGGFREDVTQRRRWPWVVRSDPSANNTGEGPAISWGFTSKEPTIVDSGGTSHAGCGADSTGRCPGKEASGNIWFSFSNNCRSAESPFRGGEAAPGLRRGADANTYGGRFPLMREGFEARFHELGFICRA